MTMTVALPPGPEVENLAVVATGSGARDACAIIDLRRPEAPVILTHAAFEARCRAVAAGLRARGMRPGDSIGILSRNRVEFLEVFFGAMMAGLIAVPVSIREPRERIAAMAGHADLTLAFADAEAMAEVPDGLPCIGFDDTGPDGYAAFLCPDDGQPAAAPDAETIAFMVYTSGSTGLPKGVRLSHRAHSWVARSLVRVGGVQPDHRVVVAAPMFHKNALNSVKQALTAGASIVILPRFDARAYLQAAADWRATHLAGVPTMYALMLEQTDLLDRLDLSAVIQLRLGSAPASQALLDALAARFPQASVLFGYGITESSPIMFGPHPEGLPRPLHSIGWPLPTTEWRLVDGTETEGRLLVRTPGMMSGYHKNPEETARRMPDGFFDTGDVVRRAEDGWFYFVGRADDMFVSGGNNIYPGALEAILERHPDVLQSAVVPAPHPLKHAVPVAFVVPRPGGAVTTEALQQHVLQAAPAYMLPRAVRFLDTLPLGPTGKVDRRGLARTAEDMLTGAAT